ncbi:MAG: cobyrinate a,c-diamide synthase [Bacteroidota bacterium]
MKKPSFLIAAPKSHSGKTLVTLGLIRELIRQGYDVQPFKCGPDYIDPMHHTQIAGPASYNLDTWMASDEHVREVFHTQMQTADVGVIEGVMGLFDGARKDQGSPAAIARLLDVPVVLVVDASSMAYSAAPLLYGFSHFDDRVQIAGVIFNKVGSESHYSFLEEAARDAGVRSLGFIPRDKRLAVQERHLGLHLPDEEGNHEAVDAAAELVRRYVDVNALVEEAKIPVKSDLKSGGMPGSLSLTTALADDAAFNFTYRANVDRLEEMGRVVRFSPLNDAEVPEADLVWLPGGYPELFAEKLSRNKSMMQSIANHVEAGKLLVAECGGMMYLGQMLTNAEGRSFPMAGLFDLATSFEKMKLHLGYREVWAGDQPFRGHEFHYSELRSDEEQAADYPVKTARGKTAEMPVFRFRGCWASYMHLYLGENAAMQSFIDHLKQNI